MIDFVRLQGLMKDRLEADRSTSSVEASGPTLEEAVAAAAQMLSVSIKKVDYELIERGSPGFLGTGKKDWVVRAYKRYERRVESVLPEFDTETFEIASPVLEDRNGDVFVHLYPDGAFLKVVPPKGKGKAANAKMALEALKQRAVREIEESLVDQIVKDAAGTYEKVASFIPNPMNDAIMSVDLVDSEMRATLSIAPPGPGGCDVSADMILSFLRNNRVVFGVNEDYVRDFADRPVFKEMVTIAEGAKPQNGRDAYMQYNFQVDQSKVRLKEASNGRVDFKELNIIQNVVEGQPLARKVQAERGTPGKTVTGKVLPAKNGKDMPMPLGKNVHLADDQLTILSDINGQVVIAAGKVNVEPVYTVDGDVCLRTGNIMFLGTVIITGSVEDGFSVKAAGNIEVHGTVGKADLEAEGDVIVHQGITGKGAGLVKAGRSVWARFIENARIEAGTLVVVSDGIINSKVDANKRIICQGKRAHIVGGHLRAAEEINAKMLGSPVSGTETICEVGFDPSSKARLDALVAKKTGLEKQLEEVELNLTTLVNIKKQRKSLPEDKQQVLEDLSERRQTLHADIDRFAADIQEIQSYLNNLKNRGKVSASSKVFPGVKVVIRDIREEVKSEYRATTFILENNLIRVTKYEETEEDLKERPDGYSTN